MEYLAKHTMLYLYNIPKLNWGHIGESSVIYHYAPEIKTFKIMMGNLISSNDGLIHLDIFFSLRKSKIAE